MYYVLYITTFYSIKLIFMINYLYFSLIGRAFEHVAVESHIVIQTSFDSNGLFYNSRICSKDFTIKIDYSDWQQYEHFGYFCRLSLELYNFD